MARRPDPVEFDQPLGKEELQTLARMLSQYGVTDAYRPRDQQKDQRQDTVHIEYELLNLA
jgi:hypothetical protein